VPPDDQEINSYIESLNKFTAADVYRYALNIYFNNKSRSIFLCGIDRTKTTICDNSPLIISKETPEGEREIYVKNKLFPIFYTCLKKINFNDDNIYRFFIR
jgi:hypothetical protein